MAIHLLPLAKLVLMTGKSGTSKSAGAAMVKQATSISTRCQAPGWLVKGALTGLIGFNLLFLLVLAQKRNIFKSPAEMGYAGTHCGGFINLNDITRSFSARLIDKAFMFSGRCRFCGGILSIPDSSLKTRR